MSLIRVIPGAGRRVRLEDGSLVPETGADVELTMHVRRRLLDGDLFEHIPSKALAVLPAEAAPDAPSSKSRS